MSPCRTIKSVPKLSSRTFLCVIKCMHVCLVLIIGTYDASIGRAMKETDRAKRKRIISDATDKASKMFRRFVDEKFEDIDGEDERGKAIIAQDLASALYAESLVSTRRGESLAWKIQCNTLNHLVAMSKPSERNEYYPKSRTTETRNL